MNWRRRLIARYDEPDVFVCAALLRVSFVLSALVAVLGALIALLGCDAAWCQTVVLYLIGGK